MTEEKDNTRTGTSNIIPLLPLRDVVVFPHMIVPLFVGREKSIAALESAMKYEKGIFMVAQKNAKKDDPSEDDIYSVGTIGIIIQLLRLPDGTVKVLVEGKARGAILEYVKNDDFFLVRVADIEDVDDDPNDVRKQALMRSIKESFELYLKLSKKVHVEMMGTIAGIEDPSKLADVVVTHLNVKLEDKQRIMEIFSIGERLEAIYSLMLSEIEILQVEEKIKRRVKKQMEKTQKDYYLNEQMRAIQKEMGEKDDFKNEIAELEKRLKQKKLSEEAAKKVRQEIKKLQMMAPMSAEATVVRNYIDWLLDMPWSEVTENQYTLKESEAILDEDHYGLKKVKERIIEYLAVQSLVKKNKGPILCLVGPPGVGKTSIAKSVARATNRKFIRISLGGVRDEAEIRGHRRTYIGAMPGKIIQSLKKAGSNNPVFCLDEVDKLCSDFRGDPSSALLEVLDPEQNVAFNDNYLDVDYDLSDILFITTANVLQTIPAPLQDRMEVIRIAGYTEQEKMQIAKRFLLAKEMEANGLTPESIEFTNQALLRIIRQYTREAGVRNLEREIASICRKVAKEIVSNGNRRKIVISSKNIPKYLGVPKFRHGETEENSQVGLTTGLAWTEFGGELLVIEASIMEGTGRMVMTGKLGDVMQESVQAALSYVRTRAEQFGLPKNFYKKIDIHVHVPEGAIPKDGPSAGIAMATSIASALLKKKVRADLAMTGEITLRGRILPIGGLKEKILAAHRGNIKIVLIPKDNEKDLAEVPRNVQNAMKIVFVEHIDEVLEIALVKKDDLFGNAVGNDVQAGSPSVN
ncbi:MAG: endopeptidase La [Smithellaceae bacterium]|jgi:ATP-dependent Lon protease|nr:endopeptidase La [Smithellaceae bacterium]MDD3258030.1 endopeptidase La [Smithellaceae bacterium]MDD3848111.1 endopeptidase La [Smithellaceae bacterium]HOQ71414.1 endopeptidase La [Smithellaceae bacterium]HPL09654.1 endopeptidase La [Smithellaceae bacterium]